MLTGDRQETADSVAGQIGMDDELGSIRVGKIADFVVCDDELNIKEVFIEGIEAE